MTVRRPPAAGGTGDLFERAAPRPWSVGELTRALRNAIEPKFRDVWVAGEVANLRRQASGHVYFSLKDDEAVIGAVLWASQARRLKFRPRRGAGGARPRASSRSTRRTASTSSSSRRSSRAAPARWRSCCSRSRSGCRRRACSTPPASGALPFIPRRVGVATSPSGAALRDFLRVLHGRFPSLPVLVAPCRVQGEGAAATVVSAVRALCRARVDVIVVTRGGGSQEDLGAFNDERLARAIAACPVPVVSAVGHEVDVTVADLVADVRAATPTHAAQLVAPVRDELAASLRSLAGRAERAVLSGLEGRRREVRALRAEILDPQHLLSRERHRLDDLAHRAAAAERARSRAARQRLDGLRARLGRQEPRRRVREVAAPDGGRDAAAWRLAGGLLSARGAEARAARVAAGAGQRREAAVTRVFPRPAGRTARDALGRRGTR